MNEQPTRAPVDPAHRIALVRHGVTPWNTDRLLQGRSDVAMLPELPSSCGSGRSRLPQSLGQFANATSFRIARCTGAETSSCSGASSMR